MLHRRVRTSKAQLHLSFELIFDVVFTIILSGVRFRLRTLSSLVLELIRLKGVLTRVVKAFSLQTVVAFAVWLELPSFALRLLSFKSRRCGCNDSTWGVKEHRLVILLDFSQNSGAGGGIVVHLLKTKILDV